MPNPGQDDDDKTQSYVALTKGTMVSHYRIVEKIGAGGMGEVYLAQDIELDRKVALKFLSAHLSLDQTCRKRFKRESQAAAKLDHPNIITVHEVSEYRGRPFFAMQFVAGLSLKELASRHDLSVEQVLQLGIQACEGLQVAHDAGIIHRDIKPSNLVMSESGSIKILDFGLATIAETSELTGAGMRIGTPRYMSPEQISVLPVDKRSDVFSLGLVLFELLTGKFPFGGDTAGSIFNAIVNDPLVLSAEAFPSLSPVLSKCLKKCLAKNPRDRFQSARELASALRVALRDVAVVGRVDPPPTRRRNLFRLACVTALAVVAAGVVTLILKRDGESTGPVVLRYEPSGTSGRRLAVLPFRHVGKEQELKYTAAGFTFGLGELAKEVFQQRFVPQQYLTNINAADYCLSDLKEAVSCDYVLSGSIASLGTQFQVSYELLSATDSTVLYRQTLPLVDEYGLPPMQENIIKSVRSILEPHESLDRVRSVTAMQLSPVGRKHFDKAVYFLDHGEYELAYEDFVKAELTSQNPDGMAYYKALALEKLGRYEDAIKSYKRVLPEADTLGMFETVWADDSARFQDLIQDTLAVYKRKIGDFSYRLTMFDIAAERIIWQKEFVVDSTHGTSAICGGEDLRILWNPTSVSLTEFLYLDINTGNTLWSHIDSVSQNISNNSHNPRISTLGGMRRVFGSWNTWAAKYAIIENQTGEVLLKNVISPKMETDDVVVSRRDTTYEPSGFYIINYRTGDTLCTVTREIRYSVDSIGLSIVTYDTTTVINYDLATGKESWSWTIPPEIRTDTLRTIWRQGDKLLVQFAHHLFCLNLHAGRGNRVAWQKALTRDSTRSFVVYREGYRNPRAPEHWLVAHNARLKTIRISDLNSGSLLHAIDLGALRSTDSVWRATVQDSVVFLSGADWGAIIWPASGAIEVLEDFPVSARTWDIQGRFYLGDRYSLALGKDDFLHIYRRGSGIMERRVKLREYTRRLVDVSGHAYLLGRTGIRKIRLDALGNPQSVAVGEIMARIASCKLGLGEIDSARVYNDRAREATGYLSASIAANRYAIMVASDSSCFAGGALLDNWTINKPYKAARDSILGAIRDSIGIDWLLTGEKLMSADPGFVAVDDQIEEITGIVADTLVPDRIFLGISRTSPSYINYIASVDASTGRLQWMTKRSGGFGWRWGEAGIRIWSDSNWLAYLGETSDSLIVMDYRDGKIVQSWPLFTDTLKYKQPNWASDPDHSLHSVDSEGLIVSIERPIVRSRQYDVHLERYSWDGRMLKQVNVRQGIPAEYAEGSRFYLAGEYIVYRYSPYTHRLDTHREPDHFDSVLVFSRTDLSSITAFEIEPGFLYSKIVGDCMVVVDSAWIRGYHLTTGQHAFETRHGISGSPLRGRLFRINDTRFVFIDTMSIHSFAIDKNSSSGVRHLFTSEVFDSEMTNQWVYYLYEGNSEDRLFFISDFVLTCISATDGQRIFQRPIIIDQPWIWTDVGLFQDFVVVGSGSYLYRIPAENMCQ